MINRNSFYYQCETCKNIRKGIDQVICLINNEIVFYSFDYKDLRINGGNSIYNQEYEKKLPT